MDCKKYAVEHKGIVATVAGLLLAGAGVGSFFFFKKRKAKKAEAPAQEAKTAEASK